jgi:hypothetical protein
VPVSVPVSQDDQGVRRFIARPTLLCGAVRDSLRVTAAAALGGLVAPCAMVALWQCVSSLAVGEPADTAHHSVLQMSYKMLTKHSIRLARRWQIIVLLRRALLVVRNAEPRARVHLIHARGLQVLVVFGGRSNIVQLCLALSIVGTHLVGVKHVNPFKFPFNDIAVCSDVAVLLVVSATTCRVPAPGCRQHLTCRCFAACWLLCRRS